MPGCAGKVLARVALAGAVASLPGCCTSSSISAVVGTYQTVGPPSETRSVELYVIKQDGTFLHGSTKPDAPPTSGTWARGCSGKLFLFFADRHSDELGSMPGDDMEADVLSHGLAVIRVRNGCLRCSYDIPREAFYLKISNKVDTLDGRPQSKEWSVYPRDADSTSVE
jgi:hypothetical protein